MRSPDREPGTVGEQLTGRELVYLYHVAGLEVLAVDLYRTYQADARCFLALTAPDPECLKPAHCSISMC